MNQKSASEIIKKLYFEYAGEIFINDRDLVDFVIQEDKFKQKIPQVYLWVAHDEVIYVGKAGKGLEQRFKQHRGGWRGNSVTGITKAYKLRETLENDRVMIYGCNSEVRHIDLFSGAVSQTMSLIDVEENFLINYIQPAWNIQNNQNVLDKTQ